MSVWASGVWGSGVWANNVWYGMGAVVTVLSGLRRRALRIRRRY